MEIILNLAWVVVALLALAGWAFERPFRKGSVGQQAIAICVLLLVLFPAISITDDLWAAHNPAETDILVRRDYHIAHPQASVRHRAPALLASVFRPGGVVILGRAPEFLRQPLVLDPRRPSRLFIRPPPSL